MFQQKSLTIQEGLGFYFYSDCKDHDLYEWILMIDTDKLHPATPARSRSGTFSSVVVYSVCTRVRVSD